MSGVAELVLYCGAKVGEELCPTKFVTDLLFDPTHDAYIFEHPWDWHIELGQPGIGDEADDSIVRCSDHCTRLKEPKKILKHPGLCYWEDAP